MGDGQGGFGCEPPGESSPAGTLQRRCKTGLENCPPDLGFWTTSISSYFGAPRTSLPPKLPIPTFVASFCCFALPALGLKLQAYASANNPLLSNPSRTPRKGAPRPPFPPVVRGGSVAVPSGGDRRPSRCPARSGHWAHRGREAGLTKGATGLGRCGLWSGLGGLRGRGLRLQPRGGLGAARGLGRFASLWSDREHITGASAGRRRRAPLGCRVSCLLLLLLGSPA